MSALLWPLRAIGALLPDGWGGLARQLAIFIPFDIAYELSRAFATGGEETALQHAHDVVRMERTLGIFHELAVQQWALDAPDFVMAVARFTYFQCQFTITFGFVIWVYIWRHYAYTMLRNVLFATFMLAVPGYILYPTAPPRLLPELGFVDPLAVAALNQQGTLVKLFGNPYAAMPSLHTATAILVGATGVLVTRHLLARALWALYPALVVFSIVATANHFFLDAIAGAGVLAVAVTAVVILHRHQGWSIAPRSRPLTGGKRPLVDAAHGTACRVATIRPMTTLPLRLDRIKSGYTDGARQLASRAVRILSESRVTPNQLTALGFTLNIVAAVLVYQEIYIAAAAVFLVGSIIDILDGALARLRGQATTFGAFIDSTTDRISEGAVLCAVTLVFVADGDAWPVVAVFVAMVASFLISYTRARAEALGLDGKAGLMGRAERVVLLAAVLVTAPWGTLPYGIALLALLTSATVLQRILSVHRQLAQREQLSKEHA